MMRTRRLALFALGSIVAVTVGCSSESGGSALGGTSLGGTSSGATTTSSSGSSSGASSSGSLASGSSGAGGAPTASSTSGGGFTGFSSSGGAGGSGTDISAANCIFDHCDGSAVDKSCGCVGTCDGTAAGVKCDATSCICQWWSGGYMKTCDRPPSDTICGSELFYLSCCGFVKH